MPDVEPADVLTHEKLVALYEKLRDEPPRPIPVILSPAEWEWRKTNKKWPFDAP